MVKKINDDLVLNYEAPKMEKHDPVKVVQGTDDDDVYCYYYYSYYYRTTYYYCYYYYY